MSMSLKQLFRTWSPQRQEEWLLNLPEDMLTEIDRGEWWWESRPEQVPPKGPWNIHLYLAGRGTGKTRSGAEWLIQRAVDFPFDVSGFPTERLVVAPTLADAKAQCIEGPSGVRRCLERRGIAYHYTKSPKPLIILTETESKIHFIGSEPDKARGFNLADVWMDEIIKWADAKATWLEGIMPALRARLEGDHPRAFITTTPKPIDLLFSFMERLEDEAKRETISVSRGSTYDNSDNLSEEALQSFIDEYEGTELGRQELYGELLDLASGRLFRQADINKARLEIGPTDIVARVVGVDPSLTGEGADHQDEMGVVVASRDADNHMYIVADETQSLAGRDAALHIWHVYARYEADLVVYEDNLGKAWMRKVLEDVYFELRDGGLFEEYSTPPLKAVHSNQGKKTRAEIVATRYEQGRVHHLGTFAKLERQMVTFDPMSSKDSPDRMDALVHAVRHLIEGEKKAARIASPARRVMAPRGLPDYSAGAYVPQMPR